MALHTNLSTGDVHIVYNWTYADQATREAATGFVLADEGKLARQLDDNTLWMLIDYTSNEWLGVTSGSEGLTIPAHKTLRQLIHFIDNGPAEGFTSGAYRETTGTAFPTAITWYTDSGLSKKKIVEKLITWTGVLPTEIEWKMYDDSEVLIATLTDTISYSGPFEVSRTRVIS
jgi:hypothetical protein